MAEPSRISSAIDATLCVVDGEDSERQSLVELLGQLGTPVEAFPSAEDFLHRLAQLNVALLVSSVRLPGIGGIDLLRQLRDRGVTAPTILISGEGDLQMAVDAMRAGAVDFIEKPIIDRIVLRRAKSALEGGASASTG
jgi:two-component system response regulator FixJ